jgi:DMSO/TMAO reductase YedYZ molybdopterin-dependent catalytic subunit
MGCARWKGARLKDILDKAGLKKECVEVAFNGADGPVVDKTPDFIKSIPTWKAIDPDTIVAYEMNGQPLPPQHGFPLRVVVPGWYGMASVKWLTSIRVIDAAYDGFQNAVAYRIKERPDDPGKPVTTIAPRALLVPPGFPDFGSRRRILDAGPVQLQGRAWSGHGAVTLVEVSDDGGLTWATADLEDALGARVHAKLAPLAAVLIDDGRWHARSPMSA